MIQKTSSIKDNLQNFFSDTRVIFGFAILIAIVATSIEVAKGRAENFVTYCDATYNFWNGINSYTQEFVDSHHRFFIYSPVFNILFTPLAYVNKWIGASGYNLMNCILFLLALKNLPNGLNKHFSGMAWFLMLIMAQSLFCFQYNMVVCNCFLWAYILLEKNHNFWAVFLIMLSATTKIYGIVELGLLLCYPKMWKNFGYAILCGAGFVLLPAINGGFEGLVTSYSNWFAQLTSHFETTGRYPSFIFMPPFDTFVMPNMRIIQASIIAVLGVLFFLNKEKWNQWQFRAQALGALMGYIVLFSEAAEYHTYVIALSGYIICYYIWRKKNLVDKILYWASLVFMSIMPIDLFCPVFIHKFINGQLYINIYVFLFMWISVVVYACTRLKETIK